MVEPLRWRTLAGHAQRQPLVQIGPEEGGAWGGALSLRRRPDAPKGGSVRRVVADPPKLLEAESWGWVSETTHQDAVLNERTYIGAADCTCSQGRTLIQ